jgi:SAM-dependent methyltransferase
MAAYGPLAAQFYDADKPLAPQSEVDWYLERLPVGDEAVLEVMCGTGRLLLPLIDMDVNLHGCDSSPAMLAGCEARLEDIGYETTLFLQDATTLNLPFRYRAAFVAAGSLQLIADPVAAGRALARIRAHLVDPGVLLLDFFVPDEAVHPPGAPVVEARTLPLYDGLKIAHRSETTIDVDARRIDVRSRYEKRSGPMILAREDELVSLTWYDEDEAVALVAGAGFADVRVEPPAFVDGRAQHRFAISARLG